MPKIARLLASFLPGVCAASAFFAASPASTAATQADNPLVSFAEMPANTEKIGLLAETAVLKIVHDPAATAISLSSNCPRNWNVNGGIVRQAGFITPRNGVAMKADALGSRAILNGKIYPLPANHMSGLQLNGAKGIVMINGQQVEPLQGSNVSGGSGQGADTLQVTIPSGFTGGLVLGVGDGCDVSIDSWKDGDVKCTILGKSTLTAKTFTDLSRAAIDMHGGGQVNVADVSAKVLVVSVEGNGSVDIQSGKADLTNATVSGDGKITMHGQFNNLKQSVQGSGSIKVN